MAEEYVNKESLAKHIDSRFGEISTPFVVREIRGFPAADVAPKSEVAMEIFEEINDILFDYENTIQKEYRNAFEERFAELKKKYTEEKE